MRMAGNISIGILECALYSESCPLSLLKSYTVQEIIDSSRYRILRKCATHGRGIGYLRNVRRINVVLTRAKFFCLSLPYWASLISHAKDASSVIRVQVNRQKKIIAELASLKALQPEAKPIMQTNQE